MDGSTPIVEDDTMLTSGFNPNSLALSFFITNTAAAPSFNPDAIIPQLRFLLYQRQVLKIYIFSSVVPCREIRPYQTIFLLSLM